MIGRVDDVHDLRCNPVHHELEPVLQGHLRRGAPLTSAAHRDQELAVANIDDRDLSTVAGDGTVDFPVEQALNGCTHLGFGPIAGREQERATEALEGRAKNIEFSAI